MKKLSSYILIAFLGINIFAPFGIALNTKSLAGVEKNIASAADCEVIHANWSPEGEQRKDDPFKFYKEGVTAKIIVKTKNCINQPNITLTVFEADTCVLANCDDALSDSGLLRRPLSVTTDNFTINLKLGEEKCEAGATLAAGYDCDLFFYIRQGNSDIYNSYQKVKDLYYECDGACDTNAAFLGITPQDADGNPIKDEVQEINAKKAIEATNTYTLLAPINGLTEINTSGGTCPDNEDIQNGIGCYLNIIFKIAIGLCGALAVIMIIVAGVQYMGDESVFGKTEAKSKITSAIFGLLIALAAYALLNTLDPALTGKNGVSVDQVSAEIDDETDAEPQTIYQSITGTTKLCTTGYTDVATYGNGSLKQPSKINICNSISGILIAKNLRDMINAAKASGIILSGYGSRSYDTQVQLRKDHHCADVYNASSSTCKPPTARPGHSNHEVGGAVDFTCNGKSMQEAGGRGSVCFQWLAQNASNYKFKNLASESWHWSFNGK